MRINVTEQFHALVGKMDAYLASVAAAGVTLHKALGLQLVDNACGIGVSFQHPGRNVFYTEHFLLTAYNAEYIKLFRR